MPQAPQLLGSTTTWTSQPSAGWPLQSAYPALQPAILQLPAEHAGVALAKRQVLPQTPQLLTLVLRLVSQPSAALLSQLPNPALQLAT